MRLIKLTIKNCGDCPYCEYDSNYGMSYNSGYDCNKLGKRIIEDIGSTIPDLTKLSIPDWYELPIVDEVLINRKDKINKILNK